MHTTYALPVARAAFPSERIALPGSLAERRASIENVLVRVGMTQRWLLSRAARLVDATCRYVPELQKAAAEIVALRGAIDAFLDRSGDGLERIEHRRHRRAARLDVKHADRRHDSRKRKR
jgi:hypothetical protein